MIEILALTTAPAVIAQLVEPSPVGVDARALGRESSAQFFAGDLEALWERLTPSMRAVFKSKAGLAAFQRQVVRDMGPETEVLDEVVSPLMNASVYMRTVRLARWPQPVNFTWSLDERGKVAGFNVAPRKEPAASRFLEYRTKAALRLPITGAWSVVWGGRGVEQNYHAMHRDQRFASDWLILKAGVSHAGDGKRNDQYYAYNQPVLAPGAGQVVTVVDGVPDNVPGEMNAAQAAGNHVVIDHGEGEFSLLAHFKPGSLKVKVGQQVQAGALLGLCGNSGNSSEAHLHYHLQNSPVFAQGEGLPAQFLNYQADGRRIERGEPTQGQVIQP